MSFISPCAGGGFRRTCAARRLTNLARLRISVASGGFTLVELMIVLAIVAVIAAYAVPAYQQYLARSRVGEGLSLAASARLAVAENAAGGAALDSGYHSPPATRNIESIEIDADTGQITIAYTERVSTRSENALVLVPSSSDGSGAAAARVAIAAGAPPSGSITWECFAAGKAASSLAEPGPAPDSAPTLPAALAPPDCR